MNLFELFATISLDSSEYEGELNDAEKKTQSTGGKIGKALATIGKASTVALGAAAAGVTAITKSAVKSYADYEQLVGGIETLFGKAASGVMANADKAFKTAGMSVNEYMETTIGSAAALINSVRGNQQKAAKLMDLSITDMADNVNKMGTSMEAVQNAYRGFSRGNYTMLDNLALGFAGTKEGMESLLKQAQKISGVKYDISSYADIVQAIHVVQTEMGITGTTAKEAAETISGSAASMKSAWTNLVTGLGNDNADLEGLAGDLIGAFETLASNVAPVVQRVLNGISKAITKSAPAIMNSIVGMIDGVLPDLVKTAGGLLSALVDTIVDNADMFIETGLDIALMIAEGIAESGGKMASAIGSLIGSIGTWIGEYSGVFLDSAVSIIVMLGQALIENVPVLVENVMTVLSYLAEALMNPDNLTAILSAVLSIISVIGTTLIENLPLFLETVMQVINGVIAYATDYLPIFVALATTIIMTLATGLIDAMPTILEKVPVIINQITDELMKLLPKLVTTGITLFTALVNALPQIIGTIVQAVPQIVNAIVGSLTTLVPAIVDAGIMLLTALVDNLPYIIDVIVDALPQIIDSLVDGFVKAGPKLMEAGVKLFTSLIDNLPKILRELARALAEIMRSIFTGIGNAIPTMLKMGGQLIQGLWQGISNVGEWLRQKISGFFGGVVQSIKNFFGIKSPSRLFAGIGEMLDKGLAKGIEDYADVAVRATEEMADDVFGATDGDLDFTAGVNGASGTVAGRGGLVINVYGAEGQNVEELAEIVSQKIAFGYTQEQAVFA